jgi:hypothetical protein
MKIDKLIEEFYESAITGLNLVDNNRYLINNKYKNLEKRLGFVEMDKELLLNFEIDEFKSIFSNFFPIYLDGIFLEKPQNLKCIKYFGISEHFEVVKEGCIIPDYMLWLKRDSNGKATFDRMEKI